MLWKGLLLSLWMVHYSVAQFCPLEEDMAPCMCRIFGTYSMMSCSNIMTAEELIPAIKGTVGFQMLSLSIEDSSILYLPSEIFLGTKFAKIYFGNSQLMSLSDGNLAFEGLENHLEELRAVGSNYVTTWDWNQLRNHKKLQLIDVSKIAMHTVESEFPHLSSLKSLAISKAELSFIHPRAFEGLKNLKLLILKENEIDKMNRSMLPTPADNLYHLDLSYNSLKFLPNDMFTKMPSLKEVLLNHNKFSTLNEKTFSGVFSSLQMLMLDGNKFICDCRLRWLVGHRIPLYFKGICDLPERIHGKTLNHIKNSDLHC